MKILNNAAIWAVLLVFICGGISACAPRQPADQEPRPALSSEEYERLGDVLMSRDNPRMAMNHYERALEADPGNLSARYKIGLLLLREEENQEALNVFKTVAEADPEFARAFEGMGRAYFQMRNLDQARLNLLQGLQLNQELWRSRAFLGMVYDRLGDSSRAVEEYQKAIDLRPEEGSLYNNLGSPTICWESSTRLSRPSGPPWI